MKNVMLINNTGTDLRCFEAVLLDCIRNNEPLPEELADLLTLEVFEVDGQTRGRVDYV